MAEISTFKIGESIFDIRDSNAQTQLANKADVANTLSGYGIEDAYTKNEIIDILENKVNYIVLGEPNTVNAVVVTNWYAGDNPSIVSYNNETEVLSVFTGNAPTLEYTLLQIPNLIAVPESEISGGSKYYGSRS